MCVVMVVVVVRGHPVSSVKSVCGYLENRKIQFQRNYECTECRVSCSSAGKSR